MTRSYTRLNKALASAELTTNVILPHDLKAMRHADALAQSSTHPKHRLGAVLYRRGKAIGEGVNSQRSHPFQAKHNPFSMNLHAELDALIDGFKSHPEDIGGASIAVSRIRRGNTFGCSYPCEHCLPALIEAGISRIVCYDVNDNVTAIKI